MARIPDEELTRLKQAVDGDRLCAPEGIGRE